MLFASLARAPQPDHTDYKESCMIRLRLFWISVLLTATTQWVLSDGMPSKVNVVGPVETSKPRPASLMKSAEQVLSVRLPAPDLKPVFAEDAQAAANQNRKSPQRIGIKRPLAPIASLSSAQGWETLADGSRLWVAEVISEGALGMRVHFEDVSGLKHATLLTYAADAPEQVEGPFDGIYLAERNSFWSPSLFTSRTRIECRVPAGASLPQFAVTEVTHQYILPSMEPIENQLKGTAGNCNIDVTCHPTWAQTANAVGGMGSVSANGQLFCTGCLLNDQNPAVNTDYFLTADHCIANQSQASSLEIYWFYQTPTCNGTPPNPAAVARTRGGADRLYNASAGTANDACFLRLRQAVPAGVTYAGWSTDAPAAGATITGIHHPRGDFKRISFGQVQASSTPNYWELEWSQGTTEPGSSGSPIFNPQGQVIGQLLGGAAACDNLAGIDQYGRFNVTFPNIRRWLLNEAGPPISTNNNNFAGAAIMVGPEGTAFGDNVGFSREPGEPRHDGAPGNRSAWWSWTPTQTGEVTIDTVGSTFDTILGIYIGQSVGSLTGVISNDDINDNNRVSRVTFQAQAGTTYRIAVDGYLYSNPTIQSEGSIVLNWTQTVSNPTNELPDMTVWAPTLQPQVALRRFNAGDCAVNEGCALPGLRRLVLFDTEIRNVGAGDLRLGSPTGNTNFTLDPCHEHYHWGNYASYRLVSSNGVVATGRKIGFCLLDSMRWDTNSPRVTPTYDCDNQGISAGWGDIYGRGLDCQWIDVTDVPDGEYTLEVEVDPDGRLQEVTRTNNIGTARVVLAPLVRPVNDDFASAAILNGASGQATGRNEGATPEGGQPELGGGANVWYAWTAPCSGTAIFDTVGSSFDTVLGAYLGSVVTNLTVLAVNDDSGGSLQSRVEFQATQGTTYRIAVDGFGTATGSIGLNWSVTGAVCTPARPPRATWRPGNVLAVEIDSTAGRTYVFEASSDLRNWTRLGTTVANGATLEFTDNGAAQHGHRFYRAYPLAQ
jgi:lysyl endopeptidase